MEKVKRDKVLENWMKEFFPYGEFKKAGIFTKEMRGDYKAQAGKICAYLGLASIYEYRKDEIRCHLTCSGKEPKPFITVVPSVWES